MPLESASDFPLSLLGNPHAKLSLPQASARTDRLESMTEQVTSYFREKLTYQKKKHHGNILENGHRTLTGSLLTPELHSRRRKQRHNGGLASSEDLDVPRPAAGVPAVTHSAVTLLAFPSCLSSSQWAVTK